MSQTKPSTTPILSMNPNENRAQAAPMDPTSSRVLLIEDNADIRNTFRVLLENEGYRVETARNGRDALKLLSEIGEPSVIFLDLNMPEMDGWEFLRRKLSSRVAAHTPVVVFSATPRLGDLEGIADWIKKPVDLEHLLEVVARYAPSGLLH